MSERTSWTFFLSGIIVLILLGLATAVVTSRYATSEEMVAHTHEVETTVARVRASLQSAQSASLAFVLIGDLGAARQYQDVTAELSTRLASLKALTSDNPTQQERMAELFPLVAENLALMEQGIVVKKSGVSQDVQIQIARRSVDVTAKAMTTLLAMRDEENRLLHVRVVTSATTYQNALRLLIVASGAVLLFLGIIFRLLLQGLSERKRAEAAVRRLSIRILQLRDEERRKIARDLHDSIGQSMAAVAMNLTMLKSKTFDIAPEKKEVLLADSLELVQQTVNETRTISHLLHPPLLDEAGFVSAAKWYIDGFTQRSKIPVKFEISPEIERLPRETELVLFRALQEALTNIHKHSSSTEVFVRLTTDVRNIVFTIQDNGRGIPRATLDEFHRTGGGSGIGLAGMKERVQDLGGRFELESNMRGTVLSVFLPVKAGANPTPSTGDRNFDMGRAPSIPNERRVEPLRKATFRLTA